MEVSAGTPVFVTGGSGFIGRALIRALRARGCHVRALARSDAASAAIQACGAVPVRGDVADRAAMQAGMAGCTLVIHAAARVDLWGAKRAFYETTVQGTKNALQAAEAARVPRFVHISTEAVLAGGGPIIGADETAPYPRTPNGFYPWSKGLAERVVIAANGPAMATMAVRPRFVWGAGDTTVLPALMAAMRSRAWCWFDGGRHMTSTCHVRNVVEGTLLAAENGHPGEIYFLTDGAPVVFRDFLTAYLPPRRAWCRRAGSAIMAGARHSRPG